MLIGQALVRPQRLTRTVGLKPELALARDALELGIQLAADPERGAQVLALLEEGIKVTTQRMRDQAQEGLERARERLTQWIQPAIDLGRAVSQGVESAGDSDGLEKAAEVFLLRLAQIARGLTLDQLRSHATLLVDIIEKDLGLTSTFLDEQIWALAGDLITRLEQIPPQTSAQVREDRLAAAALLRRTRRMLRGQFVMPALDAEQIARLIYRLIQESGARPVIEKAACVAGRVADVLEVGATVSALLPGENGRPRTAPSMPLALIAAAALGAGGEAPAAAPGNRYSWYGTWLLQYKTFFLFGLSDLENAKALALDLKSGSTPLLRFLREGFLPGTRDMLEVYSSAEEPSEALRLAILDELNRVVRSASLYEEARFTGVTLDERTRELLNEHPEGEERWRLHRMLLEDAFGEAKLAQPWRNWFLKGLRGFLVWLRDSVAGWPGDAVRTDATASHIMHGDQPMHAGSNLQWHQAPIFAARADEPMFYLFEHVSPDAMENTAWISSMASDATRLGWRIYQIVDMEGHRVPSVLNALYDLAHGVTSAAARKPYSGFDFFGSKALEFQFGLPLLFTTLGSIQGRHTQASFKNQMAFWFTTWLGDIVNYVGPRATTDSLREAVLSFLTLLNQGGPRDGPSTMPEHPAQNHNEIGGIVGLSTTLFGLLLAHQVDRKDYAHPGEAPGKVWAIGMAGGAGMGLLAGFVGTLVAEIIAWAEDWGLLGWTMLKSMPKLMVMFWPLVYSVREGDTDGGKFNASGAAFAGYPSPAAQSPYRLPYETGKHIAVGQGNQGMWSHHFPGNAGTVQVYAFDFALDQAEEILAARPGTVIDFTENVPDDTAGMGWNFIAIAHDVDDAGSPILNASLQPNAPFSSFDRDAGGTPRMTIGIYGHGRQNGVTAAFARWTPPVPTANIRGTRVRQGMPIMLAGDTGTSFHNHLHMHVVPEVLPRPGGIAAPVTSAVRASYTLPFVFSDVSGDGVCKALHWYASSNTRRTA